jgi:hypothetical protein
MHGPHAQWSASLYQAQPPRLLRCWQGRAKLAGELMVVVDVIPLPATRLA